MKIQAVRDKKYLKRKSGLTLVELVITMAILAFIVVASMTLFMSAMESNNRELKLLDDQYNTRMALLSMVTEIRRGDAGTGKIEVTTTNNRLTIVRNDGTIEFELIDGWLSRSGDSPVAFVPVELDSFMVDIQANDYNSWLDIKVTGNNGLNLEMQVSMLRISVSENEE